MRMGRVVQRLCSNPREWSWFCCQFCMSTGFERFGRFVWFWYRWNGIFVTSPTVPRIATVRENLRSVEGTLSAGVRKVFVISADRYQHIQTQSTDILQLKTVWIFLNFGAWIRPRQCHDCCNLAMSTEFSLTKLQRRNNAMKTLWPTDFIFLSDKIRFYISFKHSIGKSTCYARLQTPSKWHCWCHKAISKLMHCSGIGILRVLTKCQS